MSSAPVYAFNEIQDYLAERKAQTFVEVISNPPDIHLFNSRFSAWGAAHQ
jgi:hypothetical protein